MHNKMT